MTRYFGKVGYVETQETSPGNWEEIVTEREYYGDVLRNSRTLANGESVNDSPLVNNSISIVADAYAYQHFAAIRYADWCGINWKVTNIEVRRPRLVLTLGGVWNGNEA